MTNVENRNIKVFISVSLMGNFKEVLVGFFNDLQSSGLFSACTEINLCILGDPDKFRLEDFGNPSPLSQKVRLVYTDADLNKCEFPALWYVWSQAQTENFYCLYVHTKGVSRTQERWLKNWLGYLQYLNIWQWRLMVPELESADGVGVNLMGKYENIDLDYDSWSEKGAPLHFSGNFWWSKSQYVRLLPNPYDLAKDSDFLKWRHACEMWLSFGRGKLKSLDQSGVRHYAHEPYPAFMYRKDLIHILLRCVLRFPFRIYIRIFRLRKRLFYELIK